MPEADRFKLCGHWDFVQRGVIALLGFGRRDVADRREETAVVKPVYPFECSILNSFKGSPRSSPVDDLGLVKTVIVSAKALS